VKPNMDLRFYARGKGVSIWMIADEYGVHENTLLNRMRKQFTEEEANEFKAKVDKIVREDR